MGCIFDCLVLVFWLVGMFFFLIHLSGLNYYLMEKTTFKCNSWSFNLLLSQNLVLLLIYPYFIAEVEGKENRECNGVRSDVCFGDAMSSQDLQEITIDTCASLYMDD